MRLPAVQYEQYMNTIETLAIGYPDETVVLDLTASAV